MTRVFGLFFQILVFFAQIALTVLVFDNKVSLASRNEDQSIGDNYDKFSHGLCVFCPPDECQNQFEDYLEAKNVIETDKSEFLSDIDLTKRFTIPNFTNFTTVEEYAHMGLTKGEC